MRALVWNGTRLQLVDDAPAPLLLDGTALVRVHLAGICATDLQILSGYMGFRGILGHEFVGEVVAGPAPFLGQRVVGEINFACGRCSTCLSSARRHCPSRSVLGILAADGAFADLVRIPTDNLHLVPAGVSDREAVFTEPLAAAYEAAEQSRAFQGGRTALLGAGKLGLLVAQVLVVRGDDVTVVCRSDRRRRICGELGLRAGDERSVPRGFDLVVDATGATDGLALAIELVRPLGAIVLKSTVAASYAIDLAPLVINEVTLIGSRCGPFPPALQALESRAVQTEPLVAHVKPLRDGVAAVTAARAPGALKVLLEMSA